MNGATTLAGALVASGVIKDGSDVSLTYVKTRVAVVPRVLSPTKTRKLNLILQACVY
jgi:hypothetical protein